MKIEYWDNHDDLEVGIDEEGRKRAIIMPESGVNCGFAPLGTDDPIVEYVDTNKRRLRRRIQAVLKEL